MTHYLLSLALMASIGAPVDHQPLIQAIEGTGVRVTYHHPACARGTVDGFYNGDTKTFVICKGNRPWNENDLDTLRHEATHLLQDCVDGKIDYQMESVTPDPLAFARASGFKSRDIERLRNAYSSLPYDEFLLEVEAFAAARSTSAAEIAALISQSCPYKKS